MAPPLAIFGSEAVSIGSVKTIHLTEPLHGFVRVAIGFGRTAENLKQAISFEYRSWLPPFQNHGAEFGNEQVVTPGDMVLASLSNVKPCKPDEAKKLSDEWATSTSSLVPKES